ncbi:hypothetical protein VST7929_01518 [Vibrio stylophorae]|uniref:DUF3341 domain-containing protein n=1 Tax=Vibrio stylophorae TaxID=659351 RepID=A0ABM8ZTK0_9VIBR|nr:hypothetical protein [Vibrio stylophorae]CAH0533647.1 hypothetical protein VST7929_01518 [Vibrio stylophorae]
MNQHKDTDALTQVRCHDLPAKVYIPLDTIKSPATRLATTIHYMGLAIALIGFGFVLFGPETIYYNRLQGMSFIQYWQAYPGPIASVGMLIAVIGGKMASSLCESAQKQAIEMIEAAIQIEDSELPQGHKVNMDELKTNHFWISFVEDSEANEEANKTAEKLENPKQEKQEPPLIG